MVIASESVDRLTRDLIASRLLDELREEAAEIREALRQFPVQRKPARSRLASQGVIGSGPEFSGSGPGINIKSAAHVKEDSAARVKALECKCGTHIEVGLPIPLGDDLMIHCPKCKRRWRVSL